MTCCERAAARSCLAVCPPQYPTETPAGRSGLSPVGFNDAGSQTTTGHSPYLEDPLIKH